MRISRRAMLASTVALAGCTTPAPVTSGYKLGVVYFAPEEGNDLCLKGLFDGLKAEGIEEGKNLVVLKSHAQAEIANIPMLIQNYDSQDVNAIVTLTTPVLTAASTMAKKKPVIFTYVYDPIAAGAGKTRTDHHPNITGVGSFPPVEDTIDVIQKLIPGIKTVGTVYNSSEANSTKVISVARESFKKRGIKLEEVTATSTGEMFQAAQVLTHRSIQAMWVTGDNTALQSFDGIAKAAKEAKLPLIINDPEFTARGAVASIGLGWYEAGQSAAKLVARVLRGESPANIPFEEVAIKKVVLNQEAAQRLGIKFPPELEKEAASTN